VLQAANLSKQLALVQQQLQASQLLSEQQAMQISQQEQQLQGMGLQLSDADTQLELRHQQVSAGPYLSIACVLPCLQ